VDNILILVVLCMIAGAGLLALILIPIMPKVRRRWERRAVAQVTEAEQATAYFEDLGSDIQNRRLY